MSQLPLEFAEKMTIPLYKIVLAGDFGVGKTSIFQRYERNTFSKYKGATIGVDKMTKDVTVDGGQPCKVSVWDTVGMERNRSLTSHYYHNAHAVLLVFAVDDSNSLNVLTKWIEDVEKYTPSARNFLVGNKVDLEEEEIQVQTSTIKSFAENNNLDAWYRVSALTGDGVAEMFDDILKNLHGKVKPVLPLENFFQLSDGAKEPKDGKKCSC